MKVIQEFPRYMISLDGTVWSCVIGRGLKARNSHVPQRALKPSVDTTGYLVVCLTDGNRKVNRAVHRLLAIAYIDNPKSLPQVNHKDGNPLNNQLGNLEWATAGINTRHAIDMGMTDPRTRHPALAGVEKQDLAGNPIQEYLSLHDAERMTGVAWQNISKVCRGLRKTAGGFRWVYK